MIRVVLDPSWAPIEFRDDTGLPQGVSMDYLRRLEELLGVRLEVPWVESWSEGVQAVRDKRLDMISSIARIEEQESFAMFTKPYLAMPVNIFTRNDVSYIGSLDNLAHKRVAVVEGYAVADWLSRDHPTIRRVNAKSTGEALRMVADGEVDALVGPPSQIGCTEA